MHGGANGRTGTDDPMQRLGGQRMNITDCHVAALLAMTAFWGKSACRRWGEGTPPYGGQKMRCFAQEPMRASTPTEGGSLQTGDREGRPYRWPDHLRGMTVPSFLWMLASARVPRTQEVG